MKFKPVPPLLWAAFAALAFGLVLFGVAGTLASFGHTWGAGIPAVWGALLIYLGWTWGDSARGEDES